MTRSQPTENYCTRLDVTIQGTLVGLAGVIHGGAEVIQGNRPTEGWVLNSIGAFTLIPNYLATGIVTNTVTSGSFIPGIGIILPFLLLPGCVVWYFSVATTFFHMSI